MAASAMAVESEWFICLYVHVYVYIAVWKVKNSLSIHSIKPPFLFCRILHNRELGMSELVLWQWQDDGCFCNWIVLPCLSTYMCLVYSLAYLSFLVLTLIISTCNFDAMYSRILWIDCLYIVYFNLKWNSWYCFMHYLCISIGCRNWHSLLCIYMYSKLKLDAKCLRLCHTVCLLLHCHCYYVFILAVYETWLLS